MTAVRAYNCKSTSLELVKGGRSSCKGRGALDPYVETSGQRTRRISATVLLSPDVSLDSESAVFLRFSVRDFVRPGCEDAKETLEVFGCDVVAPGLNGEGPLGGRLVVIASLEQSTVRLSDSNQ